MGCSPFIIEVIVERLRRLSDNLIMRVRPLAIYAHPRRRRSGFDVAPLSSAVVDSLATSGEIPESLDEAVRLARAKGFSNSTAWGRRVQFLG